MKNSDREIMAIMNLVHAKQDLKSARIRSAIENGKQTQLMSECKGVSMSKFEHKGKSGNLVVYTEDGALEHQKTVNYKVITSFRPPNSLHNQLFFATNSVVSSVRNELITDESNAQTKNQLTQSERFPIKNLGKSTILKSRQRKEEYRGQPDSFEQILLKYKSKREKEKRLFGLGDQHTHLADKLNNMYMKEKRERSKMRARFSVSQTTNTQHNKDESNEINLKRELHNFPAIKFRVDEVRTKDEQPSLSKQNSRLLKVPPNKRTKRILPKLSRKELLAEAEYFKTQAVGQFETSPIVLPKI